MARHGDRRLSARARRAIADAEAVGVSVVSCFEVATLVRQARIALDREVRAWIVHALAAPKAVLLDLPLDVAVAAGSLPPSFPGDPADRFLYATAADLGARLVTKDRRLRDYDRRLTLW